MSDVNHLSELAREVGQLVSLIDDEHELTKRIAERLRHRLEAGLQLDEGTTAPNPERYVMYPLHIDPDGRFSIASAVWDVGQGTPVHGHETWGVVGIYSGIEHEVSYTKPEKEGDSPTVNGEHSWGAGSVTVCCTTDDDVHQVSSEGNHPCVGIHIYGADIGRLRRRSYDPETGNVHWFVSTWATPSMAEDH
jgi:predicted metal-dependent enzyme (double-stranded beta helix superfamily)